MKMDKDKIRGIIGTILFHLLLLLALVFMALHTPLPLPGEEGVEVNLGYDNKGTGNIQSKTPPPQKQNTPPPKKTEKKRQPEPEPEKTVSKQEEQNITQNTEEAPAIEKKQKKPEKKKEKLTKKTEKKPVTEKVEKKQPEQKKPEPKPQPKPVEKPKPVVNKRALFKGSKNRTGTGTNQGTGTQAGDQGKPHGFEDSNKYDGQGGKGNGPAYDLGGRGAKYLDKPRSTFSEAGTVVVTIWVNQDGKVTKAQIKEKGTTIIDQGLRRMALEAAYNSTFVADPEAASSQRGTITYNFIK